MKNIYALLLPSVNTFWLAALQVPLLVRHPETMELLMNLDPMVYQVIKEAEWMRKLDLDIPEAANVLIYTQKTLKSNYDQLKVSANSRFHEVGIIC